MLKPEDFENDCPYVRQTILVRGTGEAIIPDDAIDLFLGFALHLGILHHCQEEYHERGYSLMNRRVTLF